MVLKCHVVINFWRVLMNSSVHVSRYSRIHHWTQFVLYSISLLPSSLEESPTVASSPSNFNNVLAKRNKRYVSESFYNHCYAVWHAPQQELSRPQSTDEGYFTAGFLIYVQLFCSAIFMSTAPKNECNTPTSLTKIPNCQYEKSTSFTGCKADWKQCALSVLMAQCLLTKELNGKQNSFLFIGSASCIRTLPFLPEHLLFIQTLWPFPCAVHSNEFGSQLTSSPCVKLA